MIKCIGCEVDKQPSDFYKGAGNRCKECVKKRVRENRLQKIGYYREYDRKRGNRQRAGYLKSWREKYPSKCRAQTILNNAISSGHIKRKPCETCGSEMSHAHHDDYFKPLAVRWLCAAHHKQWHEKNGEAANARATIRQFNVAVYGLETG